MNGAYCANLDCEYNENGCGCGYEGSISLDATGTCESFRYKDFVPEQEANNA